MHLPIGISDFKKLIESGCYFVDKSLFIKELIIDTTEVVLLPRPRRFGKTTILYMAHYFFDCTSGENNAHLFHDLAIGKEAACMAMQGTVPSIFLTFKGIKASTFQKSYLSLAEKVAGLYKKYEFLLEGDLLSAKEKQDFIHLCSETAPVVTLENSLKQLTKLLYRKYQKKVMIFLDEYDAPIQTAYLNGYYKEMVDFMRVFLGESLKDNEYLQKGVITGILRIAQASIFSDLNNIETYSLLRREYSEYFGFTEDEVMALLKKAELLHCSEDIKAWYNGYQVEELRLYNPWSIINCIKQNGALKPYWINTSDNALIKQLVTKHRSIIQPLLEELIQGRSVQRAIDENIVFPYLEQNTQAFWSLLFFSGYLTVRDFYIGDDGLFQCEVCIPNQELVTLYVRMVREWFTEKLDITRYEELIHAFTQNNRMAFQEILQSYIRESGSYFDFNAQTTEAVYHALVLGLVAGLRDNYIIHSNRESGLGRCDVAMIPKDITKHQAMILEFKRTDILEKLEATAEAALNQISQKDYAALLAQYSVKTITAWGIAFAGKNVFIATRELATDM